MSIRLLLCGALIAVAGAAVAQSPAPAQAAAPAASKAAAQQLTPAQREAIVKFRQSMVANAGQIVGLIDNGHETQVWDNGSDVMKKAVTRDAFASAVSRERSNLGKQVSRKLARLYRSRSDGKGQLPAGDYFNVLFLTQFAKQKAPMLELVSYHYDTPTTLRVSGYSLKPLPPRASAKR